MAYRAPRENPAKSLKWGDNGADTRTVGDYEALSTARLTWLVLDRLVPMGDEVAARAALIARDPELHSLVAQGTITEDQALAMIRARQTRYGDDEGALGDQFVTWARRLGTFFGGSFVAWILFQTAR